MLGSTDVEDRDLARMRAEFRAITANQDLPAARRGRPHTVLSSGAGAVRCGG
jgi:hypothetical protein